MTRTPLVLLLLVACDGSKPAAARDPWATPSSQAAGSGASDPWATSGSPAPADPTPAGNPTPPPSTTSPLPDGDWDCDLIGTTWMNGQRYTQTMNANGFTLHGNAYTSDKEGAGTVEVEGEYATFHGGGFDNWRGAFNRHKDGSLYLVFGGETHRDATPGHGSTVNDIQCEPH